MTVTSAEQLQSDANLAYQLGLLNLDSSSRQDEEACLGPVFTAPVLNQSSPGPSQYGLLGGVKKVTTTSPFPDEAALEKDPRLFFNVASPSSTFICGSQGSGKSHTLSCMLEGCLISSRAGELHRPMTGVVFHYDTFISDSGGSPCEAAFLASHPEVNVRVLCAPTNLATIKKTYARFNIPVEPLQIDQENMNTKRMLDIMAVGQDNGPAPLYVHTVQRILREMRILQQSTGSKFDYRDFKRRVLDSGLLPGQLDPLKQRLDTLESFMPRQQASLTTSKKGKMAESKGIGSSWIPQRSQLTIVDLSCPCISPDTACSLFNVCFGIFMEQDTEIGRAVALDEAHKYMKDSVEARSFTDTLLSTVRLQRHLGARILISTQEPTISSDLLSLCTVTIVHRFTSPAWLRALKSHVAAAAMEVKSREGPRSDEDDAEHPEVSNSSSLFRRIVHLGVGEALLFSPSAAVGIAPDGVHTLGDGYMVIKVRDRLTEDGGKSVISF